MTSCVHACVDRPRSTTLARLSGFLGLALLATWASPVRAAQQPTGTVSGRVTDAQGTAIAGAQITVQETGRGTLTRADGTYSLPNLAPGTYALRVTFIGYRTQEATVAVRAGAETSQDFTMPIDPLGMEAIVVTATREPRRKLESSTAITTLPAAQIRQEEPRSTADLLKTVPGFYVESSGGEVNNNLFVRGLPADGSYRYVVMLEDGIMAFDANDLFFLGADNLIRVDENVDRIEAVRGGNSALFGSNAPGGLVNVIDKTGGPDLAGSFKAEVGTGGGMTRYGGNVNGPLAENWRFSIGGYYRYDRGIRDPGFPSARGGQLKANVTRLFDNGYLRFYAKYVNDRNAFYLPVPVRAKATGDRKVLPRGGGLLPDTIGVVQLTSDFPPGFPDNGTLTTNDANFARIPLPQGNGEFTLPLQDGVASEGGSLIGQLSLDFGEGWQIENTLRAMKLNHRNNAMPPGVSLPSSEFAASYLADAPPGSQAEFTFVDNGKPFNSANGLVQNALLWHVERPVTNVSDQFMVKKSLAAGGVTHNFTIGSYFGFYTADNLWMFNNVLTNVQNAPKLLNLVIRDPGGNVVDSVTENGFTDYLGLYVNGHGNATLFSFFGGDEIQLTDRLRVDLGGRFERDVYEQNVENTTSFDLGGPSDADNAEMWGNRSFTRRNVDFNAWAASVGINYRLNDQVSLYGRGSRGYKMPLLDQYIFSFFPDTAETLWQAEGGVKISTPRVGLSALGYWVQLQDFPSQDARIDPATGNPVFETAIVGKARTFGLEAEGLVVPYPGVRLNGQLTLQDHEYVNFIQDELILDGNWVRRIPRVLFNVGGSYTRSGISVGTEYRFVGKRFSNNANTVVLPEFGDWNARASYTIANQGITLSAAVLNLLDGKGLTEGDPRFDESGAPTGFGNARPILPRRFIFGVRYAF